MYGGSKIPERRRLRSPEAPGIRSSPRTASDETAGSERRPLRRRISIFAALDSKLAGKSESRRGRIAFQRGRATAPYELAVRAAAADVYRPPAGEPAQGWRGCGERGGRQRGDANRVGLEPTRRNFERVGWRVAAKERYAPAVPAQHQAEADQAEVVLLAGRTQQQRARPVAAVPAAREPEQSAPQDVRCEVLLGHRGLPHLPPSSKLAQVRQHDVAQHRLDAERGRELVEGALRREVIEGVKRPH